MFKNIKYRQKFTFLFIFILLANSIAFGVSLSIIIQQNSKNQIASKAVMLMETIDSIREYTLAHVQPELIGQLEAKFPPEIIPNFAARETFENFRQKSNYRDFFFKDATLEPLNPRDRADDFETEIIEYFKKHQQIQELTGFRPTSKGNLFYLARPIEVSQPRCLECHGEPNAAPSGLVERYGSSLGFRWKLNEIIGMQIIFIPTDYFLKESRQLFLAIAIAVGAFFFLLLPLSFWFLCQNKQINKRIR